MTIKKKDIKELIDKLLLEIEEEDIGISLFTTFYQNESELNFFAAPDREIVLKILRKLSDDSKQHKTMLVKLISELGGKIHGK